MKGQVSLELIFAAMVAILAASSFSLVGTEITQVQRESGIRQQLNAIGTGLASSVSKSGLLDDSDSAIISIDIPMISVIGMSAKQDCAIAIGGGLGAGVMTLTYDTVTVTKSFVVPAGMTVPNSANCGGTLTITRP